jgi:hypothetical protein
MVADRHEWQAGHCKQSGRHARQAIRHGKDSCRHGKQAGRNPYEACHHGRPPGMKSAKLAS